MTGAMELKGGELNGNLSILKTAGWEKMGLAAAKKARKIIFIYFINPFIA
jgi:hypothetical protein